MAGSYNHVITEQGNLASSDRVQSMLECVSGDVYEAVEEMYGMIWWLANIGPRTLDDNRPEELVEMARQNYQEGLEQAKANKNKPRPH